MKVRYKKSGTLANARHFNVSALNEVLTGDDSAFINELDVQLSDGSWKDMTLAFKDHDIITDNHNTCFF